MESKLNDYFFRINIYSEYQVFWITHDILKICPKTELNFYNSKNLYCILSIKISSITLDQIQLIFIENQIKFEEIKHRIKFKKIEPKN